LPGELVDEGHALGLRRDESVDIVQRDPIREPGGGGLDHLRIAEDVEDGDVEVVADRKQR
jgi:hypothetical protein